MHFYPSETDPGPATCFEGVVSHAVPEKGKGPQTMVCLDTVEHDPRNELKEMYPEMGGVTQGADVPNGEKARENLRRRPRYIPSHKFK